VAIEDHPLDGALRAFTVAGPDAAGATVTRRYALLAAQHPDYLDLFEQLAADFGTRLPFSRQAVEPPPGEAPFEPLLTTAVAPQILYGYGDPSVIRDLGADGRPAWYLVVTSNDAPDAFPILRSDDLADWRLTGFVFPRGKAPAWALTGKDLADFWAPEIHKIGDEFWVCFTARRRDHSLAIGIAVARHPAGPYIAHEEPLLTGGVIDPHILIAPDGAPHLVWKPDNNHLWPALLAELLHKRPDLIGPLFPAPQDRRTACLVVTLWPWTSTLEPMERFFLQQPLIEAATADFAAFRARLGRIAAGPDPLLRIQAEAILAALVTRIYCQPLAPDGRSLTGVPTPLLENDQDWEAHLIEGVWTVERDGRYYLFYAGNDFSTPHYGIGGAVADAPQGPYRKLDRPLLRSTAEWWGPGHPSVAPGPDGRDRMFLHAFFPGQAGYKAFRALLTSAVAFHGDEIRLSRP
jgi:arabinan endo-1,5-alpha-L-arabinosidase